MLHTPTSQPLFIRRKTAAELFEKEAAAIARMPDDDKRWPAQVLSELHKQLPFISKYDVDIEMTRIEPEAGYALGYAMLRNKTGRTRAEEQLGKATNKLRVPVIVADRLLQPFHVFEIGGKTYPLTQDRVESAMMNPAMFDGASDPPGTQSLLDQIYPPFQHRQGYGMMSGDRATVGLSKLSSAPAKTAGIMGMTYDPGNANVQALQKQYGGNWKNALAQQRGMNPAAIQPVKTASGELSPLREFLRQQEVEKTAIFTPQAVAQGAKGAVKSFENLAAKRVAGVIKPPVRLPPVTHSSPQPFIPPKVKITDKLTGATRSIQNGPNGLLLPSARPVKTLRGATLTDLPGATTLGGRQVTVSKIDPRFTDFRGALPPARPGSGPLIAGHSTEDLMAAASGGPGAAQRVVESTQAAPVTTGKLTQRTLPEIRAQAAEKEQFRRLSGTAEREAAEQAVTAERSSARARQIAQSGSLVSPEVRAAREAAPASLATKAQEIQAAPAAATTRRVLPEGTTFTPVREAPAPGRLAAKAEEITATKAAPPPASREAPAPVREAPAPVSEGAAGAGSTAAEINPSGVAGNAPPALDPSAHSFAMREMGLPANTSPEQFALFTAQAEQASARLGRKVTPQEMYRHSIAGTSAGYMDSAARAAGGGLRGLGYGIAAGGIGLGLGGMAIANKAQDNF